MAEWSYAVCNELFGDVSFEQSCEQLSSHGFHGVEIAPFTLFDEEYRIPAAALKRVRRTLEQTGLRYAGLHWLLSEPEGLHISVPDAGRRRRARRHIEYLLEISGELGGGNLILGSPNQRSAEGITPEEAVGYLKEELDRIGEYARRCDSTLLLEALPSSSTNVVNTLEEVSSLLEELGNPGLSGMFDFHNCGDETRQWPELIETYAPIIRHVHLNTREGGYPAPEQAREYAPSFEALRSAGYEGWVSLEVFSVYRNPHELLSATRQFLEEVEA